jgi:hypothetical protein
MPLAVLPRGRRAKTCPILPAAAAPRAYNIGAMDPGEPPRRLLVVDAGNSIDRSLANASTEGRGIELVFAASRDEALEALASGQIHAIAALPPLGTGDGFSFVSMARLRQPRLVAAVVLGEGRYEGAPPRIVWVNRAAEDEGIEEAVVVVAGLRVTAEELGWWDEVATEMADRATAS